jgi:BlaI family transcriptional regulator, penicillinase repressor
MFLVVYLYCNLYCNLKAMKKLTKAEEQIMQVLWELEKGFVNDIVSQLLDPKPAYNTVSTIVRILEQKGFIAHKAYGRTHEYFPLVKKEDYSREYLNNFTKNYFSNSYKALASFFAQSETLSIKELEEIKLLVEQQINNYKKAEK